MSTLLLLLCEIIVTCEIRLTQWAIVNGKVHGKKTRRETKRPVRV